MGALVGGCHRVRARRAVRALEGMASAQARALKSARAAPCRASPAASTPVAGRRAPRTRRARTSAAAARVRTARLRYAPPGAPQALLDGVELDVPAGALHVVVGRSGSGKTTLLNLLAGLAAPTEGEVHVGSAVSSAAAGAAAVAASAGIVFQFPERHFLGSTIAEELTFGWPRGGGQAAYDARRRLGAQAGVAMETVSMGDVDTATRVSGLSGGYQRCVGARACGSS